MPQAPYPIGCQVTRKASAPRFSGGTTGLSIVRWLDYDLIFKHRPWSISLDHRYACDRTSFYRHQEYRFYSKVLTGQWSDL